MRDDPQRAEFPVQSRGLYALVASLSDAGRKRRQNEDSHLVLSLDGAGASRSGEASTYDIAQPGLLLAVADGMGGQEGGDVASRLTLAIVAREVTAHLHQTAAGRADVPLALEQAVVAAHQAVMARARENPAMKSMGTTLTAAFLCGSRADVVQVGDSRAYLYRDGNLILLTQDQTIGNRLRQRGSDPASINTQFRDLLTQAVGAQAEIKPVTTAVDLEPRDTILMCTDGLHKLIPPEGIVGILDMDTPLAQRASQLVTLANDNGGPDNITVIVAEIRPTEAAK